jgi:streptogramin lyase
MHVSRLVTIPSAILTVLLVQTACAPPPPAPPALTGRVTSADDGAMEGVLVSAKRVGSTITTTVVTDAQGHFAFPSAKLRPGRYYLAIRAVRYELDGPESVTIPAGGAATADLRLRPAHDLAGQLTNAEWIASVPGTPQQKSTLRNCVGCHRLQYPIYSTHDVGEFTDVVSRMAGYAQMSTPIKPQKRLADRERELVGEERARLQHEQAAWLAAINLSQAPEWNFALTTLPRPTGRATRAIVTEYDLPRATMEAHDVAIGPDGLVWFSSFGESSIDSMDPRTGAVTEYSIPELKPGSPIGSLSLRFDPKGDAWAGLMYQAGVARLDRQTRQVKVYRAPAALNRPNTQINMTSPEHSDVDGKVWMQDNGVAGVYRLDLKTGEWETFLPFKDDKDTHNIYDVISDSQNNAFFTDFQHNTIGRIDAKTGAITFFKTPTPNSSPRRGTMDAQDRLWFGEYRADRVGMFDTKSGTFKEWKIPTPWSSPYDATVDKNGDVWTGSMLSDRVSRVNTTTGEVVEYLLPRFTNIRRVYVDNSTTPVTFWVGSNHGSSIVKLEPLD